MIELQDISKKYGERFALSQINLTFESNSTTSLIGPSGCGKSTLLRILMGLIPPSAGQILVDGQPVLNQIAHRRSIGYVVQDGGLFPHLTAEHNVGIMARHLRRPEPQIQGRLMELCDLTDFPREGLGRFPAELSGGQRQRVSLMRALMLDPAILLFDEPLGALDPMVRAKLQDDLKQIFQNLRKTVILVTHDMAEAAFLSTRLVLLDGGVVVQQGTLEQFRDRPASPFVENFLNAQRSLVAL